MNEKNSLFKKILLVLVMLISTWSIYRCIYFVINPDSMFKGLYILIGVGGIALWLFIIFLSILIWKCAYWAEKFLIELYFTLSGLLIVYLIFDGSMLSPRELTFNITYILIYLIVAVYLYLNRIIIKN